MSSTQSVKVKRSDHSSAPPSTDNNILLSLIIRSGINEVKVSSDKVEVSLSRATEAEALQKVIQRAVLQRIESFPEAWAEAQLTMNVGLGNAVEMLRFDETPDFQLSNYPPDLGGSVTCAVVLTEKLPPHAKCIVLQRTLVNTGDGVTATSAKPTELAKVQNEDSDMLDSIQLSPKTKSIIRSGPNRSVQLQVQFLGLNWNRTKIIRLPNDATYKLMSTTFPPEITYLIHPDNLECLLYWYSDIGTDKAGYQRAIEGKMLSEYPGSDEAVIIVKITAGLLRPTVDNLLRPNPRALNVLPTPGDLSKWLRDLAGNAGLKPQQEIHLEEQAATMKRARQLSHDDSANADLYGHLVEGIRTGNVQVQAD